jgi:hypothetical protein
MHFFVLFCTCRILVGLMAACFLASSSSDVSNGHSSHRSLVRTLNRGRNSWQPCNNVEYPKLSTTTVQRVLSCKTCPGVRRCYLILWGLRWWLVSCPRTLPLVRIMSAFHLALSLYVINDFCAPFPGTSSLDAGRTTVASLGRPCSRTAAVPPSPPRTSCLARWLRSRPPTTRCLAGCFHRPPAPRLASSHRRRRGRVHSAPGPRRRRRCCQHGPQPRPQRRLYDIQRRRHPHRSSSVQGSPDALSCNLVGVSSLDAGHGNALAAPGAISRRTKKPRRRPTRPARAYASRQASVSVAEGAGELGIEAVEPEGPPADGAAATAIVAVPQPAPAASRPAYVAPPPCCERGRYGPCQHKELDFEAPSEGEEEEDVF